MGTCKLLFYVLFIKCKEVSKKCVFINPPTRFFRRSGAIFHDPLPDPPQSLISNLIRHGTGSAAFSCGEAVVGCRVAHVKELERKTNPIFLLRVASLRFGVASLSLRFRLLRFASCFVSCCSVLL